MFIILVNNQELGRDVMQTRVLMSSLFETDPRLTDYDTLLKNIQDLKSGKPVQVPIYDFKSSSRIGYRLCTARPSPFTNMQNFLL
jgi:uridine kinase